MLNTQKITRVAMTTLAITLGGCGDNESAQCTNQGTVGNFVEATLFMPRDSQGSLDLARIELIKPEYSKLVSGLNLAISALTDIQENGFVLPANRGYLTAARYKIWTVSNEVDFTPAEQYQIERIKHYLLLATASIIDEDSTRVIKPGISTTASELATLLELQLRRLVKIPGE